MTTQRSSLTRWTPITHDYSGQAVGLYDQAILLVEAQHIGVADYLLLGRRSAPMRYRVRHVAYHGAAPAYWRVQLERLGDTTTRDAEDAAC